MKILSSADMTRDYNSTYEYMEADIIRILAGTGPELDRIKDCFITASEHWEKFRNTVHVLGFENRADEIHFFKFIKPRFTGLVEYYSQRYQALLFVSDGNAEKAHSFWKMQDRRIERFFARHREFVRYYEEGETEMDERYFIRESGKDNDPGSGHINNLDEQISSSHDWIVSRMIALNKYRQDVKSAIYRLEHPMESVPRSSSSTSTASFSF